MEPMIGYIYEIFFRHSNLLNDNVKEYGVVIDDECAHSMEDKLHLRALEYIANSIGDAKLIAKLALLTKDLDFARWTA